MSPGGAGARARRPLASPATALVAAAGLPAWLELSPSARRRSHLRCGAASGLPPLLCLRNSLLGRSPEPTVQAGPRAAPELWRST